VYEKDSIKVDSLKFKTPKGKMCTGWWHCAGPVYSLQSEHGSENIVYLMQSVIVGILF
jgi:hypothetical protein